MNNDLLTIAYMDGVKDGKNMKQLAQEPVAWMYERDNGAAILEFYGDLDFKGMKVKPLYTHRAPSWQGLSQEEQWNLINKSDIPADYDHEILAIARAIEQALKEKNYGN